MVTLTFPIVPEGLCLSALIGHDASYMQALQSAGTPLPKPARARALFDTGANHTSVGPSVLAALGLVPGASARTQTAGGARKVRYYTISLTLYDSASLSGPRWFRPAWTVANLPQDLPDADIILGMDLIRELELNIQGPQGQFSVSF